MTPSCFSPAAAFVLLCRPIKTSKIGVKVAGHRLCLCVSPVCRTFCDDDRGLRQPGSLGRLRYGAMACETKLTKYTRLPALFDAGPVSAWMPSSMHQSLKYRFRALHRPCREAPSLTRP